MRRPTGRLSGALLLLVTAQAAAQPAGEPAQAPGLPAALAPAEQERRSQAVLRGEGVEITVGELEDAIAQQGTLGRARYGTPESLKELATQLLRSELLAREAERRGYAKHVVVARLVKDSAAQALVRMEVDDKLTPESVPQPEVQKYYDEHPAEFHRPAMRRASQIVLDGSTEVAHVLPEALRADVRGFAELAKEHSKDAATKLHGGDLGYFTREPRADVPEPHVHPVVRASAFELTQVGDVTKAPVSLGAQLAILKLTGERPERHVQLSDAANSIRAKLWRERRQRALDALTHQLKARDKPEIFRDRIYRIRFDDMEKRPSGFAPDPLPSAPSTDASAPRKP